MARPPTKYTPKPCACGCGEITTWYHGKSRKFIFGHGRRSGGWKDHGYICIRIPNHHFAGKNGYVRRDRLNYEEFHNCCLLPWTIIHHKNGIITDDNEENLEAMLRGRHAKLHLTFMPKKDMSNRFCLKCGSKESTTRTFSSGLIRPIWHRFEEGFICHICYCRSVRNGLAEDHNSTYRQIP